MKALQKQEKICYEETEEIDIPKGIVNFLEKRNGVHNAPYQKKYSVTELVNCSRKSHYKKLGCEKEELVEDYTLENMWSTVRGDLLHKMTYAYNWRELDTEFKVSLADGKTATLVGKLDMYDWKSKTIIDLKTSKFVKWQIKNKLLPKPEHIKQIQCYDAMFSKIIPVDNLCLVYADMTDLVAYNIHRRDMTNWITKRIQESENATINKILPKGEPSFLCQFCRYQTKCFNDGNGLIEKPLSIPTRNSKSEENKDV